MDSRRLEVWPESVTEGWAFVVPISIFGSSIDVIPATFQRTRTLFDRKKVVFTCDSWSQGNPPLLAFEVGSVYYVNARDASLPWKALRNSRLVQIFAVATNSVTFDDIIANCGVIASNDRSTCSPEEFLAFLKSGIRPSAIDAACASREACLCRN